MKTVRFTLIQCGSEIQTNLDFEWPKRGWVANGPDLEWDLKSKSPIICILDEWRPFCQKLFEIQTKKSGFPMVPFLNGWGYSYSHSYS